MIARILLLLALAWIGWRLVRRALLRGKPARPALTEDWMVACAHCGIHVPQNETVTDVAGRHYCSEAHRQLGKQAESS